MLPFRLLTWNVRRGQRRDRSWEKRSAAYRAHLDQQGFDILCLQEVLPDQLEFFAELCPSHDFYAAGRDGKDPSTDEHCPVFFRRDRFTRRASGTFWLSPTPDVPGRAWGEIYPRICSWVELNDNETGRAFRTCNVHLHLNPFAQGRAAQVVRDQISSTDLPLVIAGDFNAPPHGSPLRVFFRTGLREAETSRRPTWHFAGSGLRRLDHILVSKEWIAEEGGVLRSEKGEPNPSDHFGLWAELRES